MNNKEIDGNKITCCRAQKKAERAMELKSKFEQQKNERISRYQGNDDYIGDLSDWLEQIEIEDTD